jgi:NADPH:quinone reductase-like Zn-dependent oxidoreductase
MSNQAAWYTASQAKPLKIDDAPMPKPDAHEVVIKVHAAAINPFDYALQNRAFIENFPFILGLDVSGEITQVGSEVTAFKVGDRVTALSDGIDTKKATNGGFQLYCAAGEVLVSKIPESVSYASASVLPLALCTAATGLYQKDTLNIPYPQEPAKPNGKILLVWGGSTSVGSCAIQLAIASGYEVAATAGAHNFDYVKDLGAKYVFDHRKDEVEKDILKTLQEKDFGGAFVSAMDPATVVKIAKLADQLGGHKFVSTVIPLRLPVPDGIPDGVKVSRSMIQTRSTPVVY